METKKRFKKQKTERPIAVKEMIKDNGAVAEVSNLPASYVPPHEALALTSVAGVLWKSGMFPNARNEAGAFAIVLLGRELGIGAMTALQNIAVIQGKLSCSAQLMQARATRRGVNFKIERLDNEGCELLLSKNGHSEKFSFLKTDAELAGLLKPNSGYSKYPSDMYFCRAMTRGLRKIDPECVLGLYTIDEVSDGRYSNIEDIPNAEYTVEHTPAKKPEPPKEPVKATPEQLSEISSLIAKHEVSAKIMDGATAFIQDEKLQTDTNAKELIRIIKTWPLKKDIDNRRKALMEKSKEDLLAEATNLLGDHFGDAVEIGDQFLQKLVDTKDLTSTDLSKANKGQLATIIIELEKRKAG